MSDDKFLDLSQFKKKKKIGEGSFGKVFIVEDKSTKKIYAAKVSKNEYQEATPKEMLNLSREVNIISKMEHPSILNFVGYSPVNFKNKYKPVIVTEFSPNGSLQDIFKMERKNKNIPGYDNTKKLILMYGIANGMAYLHLNNIIHRDLKPDNIFLDEYLCPKIADFGLSKITNEFCSISELKSTADSFKGTPIYMAPETWRNHEYSFKTDVYAYSLILYEMLTSDQPFKNYTIFQLMIDIGRRGKRPEINKAIPESYLKLIQSCWSEQPNDRPTFNDIVKQLKNDPGFLLDGVVKEDYYLYIDFLEKSRISFDATKKIIHLSDFINSTSKTYKKVFVSQNKEIRKELQKIIEEEKIEETEPKIERQFKFISSSTFYELDNYCQNLILEIEEGKEDLIVFVAESFIEGSNDFPKETDTGIKYFEYAISKQNVEAMETYGKLLFQGETIPKDEEKAVKILKDAVERHKSSNAKLQLSKIILSHQSFDVNDKNENINWPLAKQYSKEAADAGNIEAILHYADLSMKEKKNKYGEIHTNVVESFNYLKKAVDKGDATAIALYGQYIEFGRAYTKPDPEASIQYYKESYEKGDMTGYALLGEALYNATGGLIKNEEDGENLIQISFEQNNIYGIRSYAVNLVKEKEEQIKYLKILADRGDALGYLNFGLALYKGEGIEKNVDLGIKYIERAIEEGSSRAAHVLGMDYLHINEKSSLKKDLEKGMKYMKMAAENGSHEVLFTYPFFLSQLPDAVKYKDDIEKYLKKGISLGMTTCMQQYSLLCFMGNIFPRNFAECAKYTKMAADAGDKNAMNSYADFLDSGIGVEKNEKESMKYRLMAKSDSNECPIQ
ncbi:hypothetical protein M9Y10_035422 [Tritrichomonas musculus]|uniref:Protein kinase domain-containing protein n=1 Tax=Tritrichomonas musculus TaxID=1915356 RepID=A0ABR2KHL3_9EUKA